MGKTIGRREAISVMGAAGAGIALGCATDSPAAPTTDPVSTNGSCLVTPTETAGPFPNVADLVRSDIREDRPGTPLRLTVRVVDATNGCSPVAGAEVEVWQCDAHGDYSEYGSQSGRTWLRGRQTTGADGEVVFTTVYPGWYPGRATHVHVEARTPAGARKVSQIAFAESVNAAVYATGVYAARGANPTSNQRDGIFADSLAGELVTPAGDPVGGYTATFRIGLG